MPMTSSSSRTHLKVVGSEFTLADSAGLEARWAKTDNFGPLLLLLKSSPEDTGWSNGQVDVNVASGESTNTGADNLDVCGALTGVAEQEVGDVGESVTVVLAGSETRGDGEGVG